MRSLTRWTGVLSVWLLLVPEARALAQVTRVVDNDGHGSQANCDSQDSAFMTIGGAIAASSFGDSVIVCPGTYVENVNFGGKSIPVRARYGPYLTIIDGNAADSVVTFAGGEGPAAILDGFTIRNGRASFDGGGIRIANASPTVLNNLIMDNRACSGTGVSISFGSPLVENNVIAGNTQAGCSGGGGGGMEIGGSSQAQIRSNIITNNTIPSSGGGIALFASGGPTIERNIISGNTAGGEGGGLWLVNQSDALITGNLIFGNSAAHGGGIYWMVPSGTRGPLVVNNTIADNSSPDGSAIFADGFDAQAELVNNVIVAALGQTAVICGNFNDVNPPVFRFNNVFSASGSEYGGTCTNQTGVNGNISAASLFANPSAGDYRLKAGSPGIDAGDVAATGIAAVDLDGSPRVLDGDLVPGAIVDIGADEISPTPKVTIKINGRHRTPSDAVFTPGPIQVTLDISPTTYAQAVDWYLGIGINGQTLWITPGGITPTPAPLITAPPVALKDVPLFNLTLPVGATLSGVFGMVRGGALVAVDVNSAFAVDPE